MTTSTKDAACPVAEIGRQIAALHDALGTADARDAEAASGPVRASGSLYDHLAALAELATCQRAESTAGALTQVMIAYDRFRQLVEEMGEGAPLPVQVRRIERCLYSVRRFLAADAGLAPGDLGGRFFMPEEHDPFTAAQAALAAHADRNGEGR